MKKRVLVCGAGGFIGGHLVQSLLNDNEHDVVGVDVKPIDQWFQQWSELSLSLVDLRSRTEVAQLIHNNGPYDTIYNLAADMGGIGFIENNKSDCMLNVLINTNLLMECVYMSPLPRYFFASSACVYAAGKQKQADTPALKEEDAYPAMPEDGYGWEKLFSEQMCRHFSEDYKLDTRVARFHNVYGPYGAFDGGREKAPAAICRKVVTAVMSGQHEIEIWGDGKQTRSFMWIGDCVYGIKLITNGKYAEPLNLGSSESVTIDELVSLVEEIAGVKLRRKYNQSAPQGVRGRNSDNSRILDTYGWEPRTALGDGLEITYRWIWDELAGG